MSEESKIICCMCGEPPRGLSIHGEHGYICSACVYDCAELVREAFLKGAKSSNIYQPCKPDLRPNEGYAGIEISKGDL